MNHRLKAPETNFINVVVHENPKHTQEYTNAINCTKDNQNFSNSEDYNFGWELVYPIPQILA